MDMSKAFGFVFEDEEWVGKVLIGGLIFLIPVIGQLAAVGYSLKVAQNVAQGNPRPLPTWSEFGDHIMRGLYALIIQLVYALPSVILGLIFACVTIATSAGASDRNGSGAAAGVGVLGLCLVPLIIILSLLSALLAYPAVGRYLATNSLAEAFKFKEVIAQVRGNIGPWVIMLVVVVLASFVGGLGAIACGVGLLFTNFYAQCVIGHALGQTIAQQGFGSDVAAVPPGYGPPPTYQ